MGTATCISAGQLAGSVQATHAGMQLPSADEQQQQLLALNLHGPCAERWFQRWFQPSQPMLVLYVGTVTSIPLIHSNVSASVLFDLPPAVDPNPNAQHRKALAERIGLTEEQVAVSSS